MSRLRLLLPFLLLTPFLGVITTASASGCTVEYPRPLPRGYDVQSRDIRFYFLDGEASKPRFERLEMRLEYDRYVVEANGARTYCRRSEWNGGDLTWQGGALSFASTGEPASGISTNIPDSGATGDVVASYIGALVVNRQGRIHRYARVRAAVRARVVEAGPAAQSEDYSPSSPPSVSTDMQRPATVVAITLTFRTSDGRIFRASSTTLRRVLTSIEDYQLLVGPSYG